MTDFLSLAISILKTRIGRKLNVPLSPPFAVFISVTEECYSRCKTCYIWKKNKKKKVREELSLEEWRSIFRNLGKSTYWISITGGEPILREDLCEIIEFIALFNKPKIISIALSGIYPKITLKKIKRISEICKKNKIKLYVNISLDDIEGNYEKIRGIPAFKKVKETIRRLKLVKRKNPYLRIGVNCVISKYNLDRIKDIYDYVNKKLQPDSFLCEPAQNKESLYCYNLEIQNDKLIDTLSFVQKIKNKHSKSFIVKLLRENYYRLILDNILTGKKSISCYSGYGFCFISASGKVMSCSVKNMVYGDLRKEGYNLKRTLLSPKAYKIREKIKKDSCYCNDCAANYINMVAEFI